MGGKNRRLSAATTDAAADPLAPGSGWPGAGLNRLRRLHATVCRPETRVNDLDGWKYVRTADDDADKAATNAMTVRLLRKVYEELQKQYGPGEGRPSFTDVADYLASKNLPFPGNPPRKDAIFKDDGRKVDWGHVQEAIKFLLLGFPFPPEKSDEYKIWERVDDYFFRLDPKHPDPVYFSKERRGHDVPCTATELAGELYRVANKLNYRLAAGAEVVWVLGAEAFPRHGFARKLPAAVAEVLAAGGADGPAAKVQFVYTDCRDSLWAPHADHHPTPSASLDEFERTELRRKTSRRPERVRVPPGARGDLGEWAGISTCFQFLYLRVDAPRPFDEDVLYVIRGVAPDADDTPVPVVTRANPAEKKAFDDWRRVVQRYRVGAG